MTDPTPDEINQPPFPLLQWNEYSWHGEWLLTSWAGFQRRLGPYGVISSSKPTDGLTRLDVASLDDARRTPPTQSQERAFEFLLANEGAVTAAVLERFVGEYPQWQADWAERLDEDEFKELMPLVETPVDLRRVMGPSTLHVLTVERDGLAYTGLEFGCTWDSDDGLGVMLHGTRIVAVGGASTAFENWIAERDLKANDGRGA